MTVRDTLPAILRGDEAAGLEPADRDRLEAVAHDAATSNELRFLKDECAARLRQPDPPLSVSYLLAAASALLGEVEAANQTLLRLGEKLADAKRWEPLVAVAERSLDLETTQAAARLLTKAHEGIGKDPERIEALERAAEILEDDLDHQLLLAVRLGDAGEIDRRRELLARLMPAFAAEARYAGLEEAALEFSEHLHADGLLSLIRTLPSVVQQKALAEAKQLLGIARTPLVKIGRFGEAEEPLRALLAKVRDVAGEAEVEALRPAVLDMLRQAFAPRVPDVEQVVTSSGIEDTEQPLLPMLERFDRIAALAPGAAVNHASFGAGVISGNDGETVLIDFAGRKGHRMPYDAAKRTLGPIDADDLRLLQAIDPKALAQLRADAPGEVVARALLSLGGEADAKKLKLFLVGSNLVPPKEWTSFWRKAKAAAETHPRIDHRRAFEQFYKLVPDGEAIEGELEASDIPLPPLEIRKPPKSNLTTLKKFLQQHPQAESALAKRFGRYLEKVMLDEDADRTDRARAGLYVFRWDPSRQEQWVSVLKQLWDQRLGIGDLSGEDEQLALLTSAHAAGVEADAILSALDSRFAAVREQAAQYRAALDDAGRAELRRTLLDHAPRYASAALRLIEEELGRTPPPADCWRVMLAALALIEERPKPSVATKVLRWLEPGGAFDAWLHGQACSEDMQLRVRVLLRQWRSSDRFLLPSVDLMKRLGLTETVEAVERDRRASVDKLFEGVGQQAEDTDIPVMTRATWERLSKELERLEVELRTTIPQTIQKARELGDLKENAEYHAAKDKQRNVSKLVASLQSRLTRARFVEEADYRDGVVGLGSEVVLESDDDVVTYWILGEGEHHHGDHVVSFQAPVGRALMGRSIGDEVAIGEAGAAKKFRIVSIDRKIPEASDEASNAPARGDA